MLRTMLRGAFVFVALAPFARAQIAYSLVDLSQGNPFDGFVVNGINGAGHLTGYGVMPKTGDIHAYLWSGGAFQDLGAFGYPAGDGIAINDSDQIAADGIGPGSTALSVTSGTATAVGDIDGGYTSAAAINSAGDIVGQARTDDGGWVGFSWVGGTFNDLSGFGVAIANSLDSSDDVVGATGYTWVYGGYLHSALHACVYSNGVLTDLGNLTGDPRNNSEAFGIDDAGRIVGYSYAADGLDHAFLFENGAMQDLGTIHGGNTTALAINAHGLVVGNSANAYGANLGPFVGWNGTLYDFATLLGNGGAGWSDLVITGLNDQGAIVGYGTLNGATEGFLAVLPSAAWKNYGAGFAGTNGVPSLTAESAPVLGTSLSIDVGNSLGAATSALALVGFSQGSFATGKGGTVLVVPSLVIPIPLPPSGTTLVGALPDDPTLAGLVVDMQAIEIDAGAAKGYSFTAGLELDLGY